MKIQPKLCINYSRYHKKSSNLVKIIPPRVDFQHLNIKTQNWKEYSDISKARRNADNFHIFDILFSRSKEKK